MIRDLYNIVMNADYNGIANLPNMVKFQLMIILSFMWSIIFTLMIGSFLVLGPTIVLHVFFLIGVYFTSEIFSDKII
ncbi:MAG: hypothetical protein CMP24_00080 [Rickettsiales bacterium]|nr:hypothetical protein [Rickettsiales bacterium]